MDSVLFVIWRESVEAMLVIGILHAWLKVHDAPGRGQRYLWSGVALGVALALLLALAILAVQSRLSRAALDYFGIAMVLAAAALITQMVFWMRRRGRSLKRELESGMSQAAARANWLGMTALAAIAVGREGAETVVFLYGLALERQGVALVTVAATAGLGLALALLTYWLLAAGGRYLNWRWFFRISEAVLLLLASALLIDGVEKLIGLDVLPALMDPVWDSSAILDDGGRGGRLAALTGYRAHPALLSVLVYLAYWAAVIAQARLRRAPQQ